MNNKPLYLLMLTVMLCCAGCSKNACASPETVETIPSAPQTVSSVPVTEPMDIAQEAFALAPEPEPAVAVILEAVPSGTAQTVCEEAIIDYSHKEEGYVMVRYTEPTDKRLKVLVKGPATTYSYNLPLDSWTVFPLSDGNGSYQVGIYKNVSGTRYAAVTAADFSVELLDEFVPFLRPNQYVDYSCAENTVALGLEITQGIEDPLHKVAAVYDHVVSALTYDDEKAATVKSGYLPVLDQVLEEGKGICFDYAAVMTAMLRSQEIPCKLVVGYAGSIYHAWISVWTDDSGWIDGAIFFDGHVWHRMDPTFASSGDRSEEIMDFIQNGNYQVKYLY